MSRYVIVGAGGIGVTVAAELHRAGRDVVLVARGAQLALTQVASGSTLSTERALDRHWRNVTMLAAHNPSIYKQQVLGGYEVHRTKPPLDVYF